MRITINGTRWDLRFVSRLRKGVAGDCDSPTTTRRAIRVRKGLGQKLELDTVLHELLHAADWHKNEEWVNTVATDVAEILWKLGWRKPEDKP